MVAAAPVVEKVTRTRQIPPEELKSEEQNRMPEFWTYIESLSPEQWNEHIVYLYRMEPKASTYPGAGDSYLEKIVGHMDLGNGRSIPWEERGIIEDAIRQKYGGRAFRLICKKGKQRITEGKFVNEAPPRYPELNPQSYQTMPLPNSNNNADSSTASVANKAIDTVANQNPTLINIAIDAVRQASNLLNQKPPVDEFEHAFKRIMLDRMINPPAPAVRQEDETEKAIRQAMLQRLMSDPLEAFLKFKEVFAPPQTNSVKETLSVITELRNSGLLGGKGGGVWELAASALPVVASAAKDVMREWRMGMEAQERGVAVMRGANPAPRVVTSPAELPPINQPAPEPTPAAAGAPQVITGDPPLEWIEQKIVEILKLQGTVDEAVDDVLAFLYVAYPNLVALLLEPPKLDARLKPGEEGLLMLFQHRPVLQQIPVNPRLTEFIKKFMSRGTEEETKRLMGGATPSTN